MSISPRSLIRAACVLVACSMVPSTLFAQSKKDAPRRVVVISLDGAQPALIETYLKTGALDPNTGLGRLARHGVVADQNITVTPSVTAVSHLAIATGSTAAHNDVTGNMVICHERRRRCLVLLANDVRAERIYPEIEQFVLGLKRMPWHWEYNAGPAP